MFLLVFKCFGFVYLCKLYIVYIYLIVNKYISKLLNLFICDDLLYLDVVYI